VKPAHLRMIIDEVAISGLSSLEGRRLVDALERELLKLAPSILRGSHKTSLNESKTRIDGGTVRASRRIEQSATSIARALAKAVKQ